MTDNPKTLSPNKAAKRAGVSRGTIMNWLEASKIRGIRDNRNNWQIDLDSLLSVLDEKVQIDTDSNNVNDSHIDMPKVSTLEAENAELRGNIKALEARVEVMQERLSDTKADRDKWQEQAAKAEAERKDLMQRLLPPEQGGDQIKRRGLFGFLRR